MVTNQLLLAYHLFCYSIFIISQLQEATANIGLSGCETRCGNIDIPYPFGTRRGCYLDKAFEVTCNTSTHSAYLPQLQWNTNVISVADSFVRVTGVEVQPFNLNKSTGVTESKTPFNVSFVDDHFRVSPSRNKFVTIGCDVNAYIFGGLNGDFLGACGSFCNSADAPPAAAGLSSCYGLGCCRTDLARYAMNLTLWVETMSDESDHGANSPCGYMAFVDKEIDVFNKFVCNSRYEVPMILEWKIGNTSCEDAKGQRDYGCGDNTDCRNSSFGTGYQCICKSGYTGNPYISDGCKDIDECKGPEGHSCPPRSRCVNSLGSYSCLETHVSLLLPILGTSLAIGLLAILVGICFWIHRRVKKINERNMKQKYFKKNGGLLLKKQMSSCSGSVLHKLKLFTIEELKKATDNFSESRVLGKGGLGTVYKGMLSDGSIAAVKIANIPDESQVGTFINEVFILSQIKHRHIIGLLGCCLETEVPLLVYEYVSNGTLHYHLHEASDSVISWENRLRIAIEIAGALAYLHSYASLAIFHRDIKSTNILLDENYRAVVSDFGLSRSVSIEKTHLTTRVGGTFGYLDPEYFRSGQLNDKSDVYAFGVVLAELLTGRKAVSFTEDEESLAIYFRTSLKKNCLPQILDKIVADGALDSEVYAAAKLCKRCLKLNSRKRPSMKDVAAELDRLTKRTNSTKEPLKHQESFWDGFYNINERLDSCLNDSDVED